ncbi:MAG: hypothetical protein ACJAXX_002252 [Roseivirga sp.]|jgi:uncharacterized protein YqgV (UPF0045/DUF77 family)
MEHKINLGLQVIPITNATSSYQIIDECIGLIQSSNLPYEVTAFETIIEGRYQEVMELVTKVHEFSLTKTNEVIFNIRIHSKANGDVLAEEKTKKFH